jgi:hypothetical protein
MSEPTNPNETEPTAESPAESSYAQVGPPVAPTAAETRTVPTDVREILVDTVNSDDNVDSDDDLSLANEEEGSEGITADTEVVEGLTVAGRREFTNQHCLLEMSVKVEGRPLCCGNLALECKRPKHQYLRQHEPTRRGTPGEYETVLNASGNIHDALKDTYVSLEDRRAQRTTNRALMTELVSSTQKDQTEGGSKFRTPTMVQFKTTAETGAIKDTPISRQDTMKNWSQAFEPTTLPPPKDLYFAQTDRTQAPPLPTQTSSILVPNQLTRNQQSVKKNPAKTAPKTGSSKSSDNEKTVTDLLHVLLNRLDGVEERQEEIARRFLEPAMDKAKDTSPVLIEPGPTKEDDGDTVQLPFQGVPREVSSRPACPCYAVGVGRETGIFYDFRQVSKATNHYSGATYKKFKGPGAEVRGWKWLQKFGIYKDDELEDLSDDEDSRTQIPDQRAGRGAARPNVTPNLSRINEGMTDSPLMPHTMDQIIDVHHSGPDTSTGKSKEMYGTSVQVEQEVLKLLCPKGVTASVRKELAESAVDVVSLPGKFSAATGSAADGSFIMDQFAEAVGDLTDMSAKRVGSGSRDSQWRLVTRNALDKIKTAEDLDEATDELISQNDNVFSNMEASLQDILFTAGWTVADSEFYCSAGLLPRINKTMMSLWIELHLHFQKLRVSESYNWEVVSLHIAFFAASLRRIRQFAITRNQMIWQHYTFLRDARAKGWQDLKLIGILTKHLFNTPGISSAMKPSNTKVTTSGAKEWKCSHCHTDLHEGGAKKCPARDLTTKKARQFATTASKDKETPLATFEKLVGEE